MNTNNKNPKQKTQKRRRRGRAKRKNNANSNAKAAFTSMVRLSPCALRFLKAATNPFNYQGELPCIPDLTIVPSGKVQVKVRGSMSTGTTGDGYVLFNPFTAIFSDCTIVGANIDQPIIFTDATYANTGVVYTAAAGALTTVGTNAANSNSPYISSLLYKWRLVAAGLKVQYTGTTFRNQGTVILNRTSGGPGNNIISGTTFASLLQNNYTRRVPVSRKPEYVSWTHDDTFFTDYKTRVSLLPTLNGGASYRQLLIGITGGDTTSPQVWNFEAVAFYEIIGVGVPLTPSDSDPLGYGSVMSSLPSVNPSASPAEVFKNVYQRTLNSIAENASGFISNRVVPAATAYVANKVLGPMSSANTMTIEEID